ncbi:hypothetical protein F4861DRAFT_516337 [Xylaria intraflava]|nr:hypothetical protein F4861DRAFT_516337 [Xylaria intraflava]
MRFYTELVPLGLLVLNGASAAPSALIAPELLARDYTGYDQCSSAQKDKINHALQDAAILARQVAVNRQPDHGSPQTYRSSPAYTNYFQDSQYGAGVSAMFNAIGQQSQPPAANSGKPGAGNPITLNQFKVHISCQDDSSCKNAGAGTKSLVITDAKAISSSFVPTIRFCPQFFQANEARTKNNLDSLPYKKNPGRRDSSWCKAGQKFNAFEVAGTTVLHELTHLNEAGQRAGLPLNPDGEGGQTHGTDDIYSKRGYSADPETAARQLHANWKKATEKKLPKNKQPPFAETLNADSYAASATEWWFMSMCGFDSIAGN